MTKEKKVSNMVPRKKATREQRVEAVMFIKAMCEKGNKPNQSAILKVWGTGGMVQKLTQIKVLRYNKAANQYDWISKESPSTIVDKNWHAHGHKPNRGPVADKYLKLIYPDRYPSGRKAAEATTVDWPPIEEKKDSNGAQSTFIPGINAEGVVENDLITKYGGSINNGPVLPRALFIDNCIQDCIQYKIIEKGAYIDEKLIRAGYL